MATVHGENVRVYNRTAARNALYTICGVLAIAGSIACGDACHSLAVQICNCGRTQIEQASCIQRVNTDTGAKVSDADRKVCEKLQETCTCQALSDGDLAACGLSNE